MSGAPGCDACATRAQSVLRRVPAVTLTGPPRRVTVLLCNQCRARAGGAWRWRWRLIDAADDLARETADADLPDLARRGRLAIASIDQRAAA